MRRWIIRTKHFLIALTKFFALCGAVLAILWITLLASPTTLLNKHTLTFGRWLAGKADVAINWKTSSLQVDVVSFARKRFHWLATDFCYQAQANKACFADADVIFELDLNPFSLGFTGLGPVEINGGDIEWTVVQDTSSPPSEFNYQKLVKSLERIKVEPLHIDVTRWVVRQEKDTYQGRTEATLRRGPQGKGWDFSVEASRLKGSAVNAVSLRASVENTSGDLNQTRINAYARADLTQKGRLIGQFKLAPVDQTEASYDLDVDYSFQRRQILVASRGRWRSQQVNGTLEFRGERLAEAISELQVAPCTYSLKLPQKTRDPYQLQTDCRGRIQRPTLAQEASIKNLVPRNLSFTMGGNAQYFHAEKPARLASNVQLQLTPFVTETLEYSGKIQGQVNAIMGERASDLQSSIDFDTSVTIKNFARLVETLHYSPWAIPAPFNVLTGTASCGLKGRYTTVKDVALIPVQCRTDLTSPEQMLLTKADGVLELDLNGKQVKPSIRGDVTLSKIKLVMPEIGFARPFPKVVPDKRIVTAADQEKTLPVSYRIGVKTVDPILLKSNLSKEPIPVNMDIKVSSNQPMEGTIQVRNFGAELFRRRAYVDHLRLLFSPDTENAEVDGLIIVDTNDYKISVMTLGTTAKPRISLYSDPPLPERDLMAVLLFGRVPEALDSDEALSADDARAAVADGAINLISMYYLASTPVESVGYNPHTGVFSAKVALAKGFSLTLGTNADTESQLGLRKRIGKNWTAETMAVKNEQDDTTKGVAMFTWKKRY